MDGLLDTIRAGNGPGSVQKRSVQKTLVFWHEHGGKQGLGFVGCLTKDKSLNIMCTLCLYNILSYIKLSLSSDRKRKRQYAIRGQSDRRKP